MSDKKEEKYFTYQLVEEHVFQTEVYAESEEEAYEKIRNQDVDFGEPYMINEVELEKIDEEEA